MIWESRSQRGSLAHPCRIPGAPMSTRHTTDIIVYKIVPAPLWRASEESGAFTGSPVDVRDGFIHFSTAEQVRETAARHFAGVDNLLLVAVSAEQLDIKWERSRGGALFPHLYASLPIASVLWARDLPLIDGAHVIPELSS
jgi:uncharacterized protein (DUF952 family)